MGSVFALMALGYSMVYGIVKMINFAHSEFITIGGFVAFFLAALFHDVLGWSYSVGMLLLCLVGAIVVCVIIAILTERLAYRPLRTKGSSRITALITAIGVSYILGGTMNAITGSQLVFPTFFDSDTVFIISIVTNSSIFSDFRSE